MNLLFCVAAIAAYGCLVGGLYYLLRANVRRQDAGGSTRQPDVSILEFGLAHCEDVRGRLLLFAAAAAGIAAACIVVWGNCIITLELTRISCVVMALPMLVWGVYLQVHAWAIRRRWMYSEAWDMREVALDQALGYNYQAVTSHAASFLPVILALKFYLAWSWAATIAGSGVALPVLATLSYMPYASYWVWGLTHKEIFGPDEPPDRIDIGCVAIIISWALGLVLLLASLVCRLCGV